MIHETPILKIRHATSENNEKLYPLKNFENKYFSKTGYDEIILFSFASSTEKTKHKILCFLTHLLLLLSKDKKRDTQFFFQICASTLRNANKAFNRPYLFFEKLDKAMIANTHRKLAFFRRKERKYYYPM